jgi:hypothetical protein
MMAYWARKFGREKMRWVLVQVPTAIQSRHDSPASRLSASFSTFGDRRSLPEPLGGRDLAIHSGACGKTRHGGRMPRTAPGRAEALLIQFMRNSTSARSARPLDALDETTEANGALCRLLDLGDRLNIACLPAAQSTSVVRVTMLHEPPRGGDPATHGVELALDHETRFSYGERIAEADCATQVGHSTDGCHTERKIG